MTDIRKALEPFAAIAGLNLPDDHRVMVTIHTPDGGKGVTVLHYGDFRAARAALSSNEEAGEAALAGAWEKCREAAARVCDSYDDTGFCAMVIRDIPNPYKIPTVNGTDEPMGGVIGEAGKMDPLDVERAMGRVTYKAFGHPATKVEMWPNDLRILVGEVNRLEAALREAGGRDHVEMIVKWLRSFSRNVDQFGRETRWTLEEIADMAERGDYLPEKDDHPMLQMGEDLR